MSCVLHWRRMGSGMIKIELNQEETTALFQIFDLALKAGGIGALNAVSHLKAKIDAGSLPKANQVGSGK